MQYQSCLFLSHISCLSKWDFPELGDNIVDSLLFRSLFYSSSCIIIGPTKWISHCLYVIIMSHTCLEWIFNCLNVKESLAQNRRDVSATGLELVVWPVWLNGWVFVYDPSGCWFESCCSHLSFSCLWWLVVLLKKWSHHCASNSVFYSY